MSEIVVNVTDPGSYAVSVEGATPTTATVSNGGSVTVSIPDVTIGDVTGLQAALDGKADDGHGHAYPVTSVNGLTGDVVIEAGGGGAELSDATPEPLGTAAAGTGTLASRADHVHAIPTAADIGALDSDSVIDGGDYIGQLVYGISITTQPQDQSVLLPVTSTWSYTEYTTSQPNTFVAPQGDGGLLYLLNDDGVWSSTDYGETWSLSAGTWSAQIYPQSLQYGIGGGKHVAINASQRYSYVATSDPQLFSSWTETANATPDSNGATTDTYATDRGRKRIAYANGVYLACGPVRDVTINGSELDYSILMASVDGVSWVARSSPFGYPYALTMAVAASSTGRFVACGMVPVSPYYFQVFHSNDSFTWNAATITGVQSSTLSNAFLAYGNGVFVCITNTNVGNNRVFTSSNDGYNWQNPVENFAFQVRDLVFDGTFFVAVAENVYATSQDGVTWTNHAAPAGTWWNAAVVDANGDPRTLVRSVTSTDSLSLSRTTVTGTGSASLSVSAITNAGALSYQWQESTDAGATWSDLAGQTSASLSIADITSSFDGRQYRAVVSASQAESVTSNAATLTVT